MSAGVRTHGAIVETVATVAIRLVWFRSLWGLREPHGARWPSAAFREVFVPVLRIAGEAGMVQLGNIATDGTNIPGNASRHTAMSYGSMRKEADRLRDAIEALVTQAYQQDAADDAALGSRRGDELPAELARRADRLATIEAAMRRLEARAQADAEAERPRRAAVDAARPRLGRRRRGKAPTPVDETPDAKAQTTFTDPEWPRMRTNNQGWEYCGKAQARVDAASQILVACDVTTASHDTQHAEPMARLTAAYLEPAGMALPPDATGSAQKIPATYDRGYDSAAAAAAVEQRGFEPSMATDRQRHHASEAEERQPPATATARMAAQVRPPTGRALYARRTGIVEPVGGQIKAARGFRRFLWRGLDNIRGEGHLVCVTPNLLKLWRSTCAPSMVSSDAMAPMDPQWPLARCPAVCALTMSIRSRQGFSGMVTLYAQTAWLTRDPQAEDVNSRTGS